LSDNELSLKHTNVFARDAGGVRTAVLSVVLAAFVIVMILGMGVPALRHDWRIPTAPAAIEPWLDSLFEGWLPVGIGSAQAYPTFYLIGLLLWPFMTLLGSFGLTVLLVATTVALAAGAAMLLARRLGARPWAEAGLACLAVLNPWVYSKYVAGHILMIFSYAVLLGLLSETTRSKPRGWVLVPLAALSISQIEFFLIAAPLLLLWSLRHRSYATIAALLCVALPIAYGITASYGAVRATPFNLAWQRSQSLDLGQAAILQGYATEYARSFGTVAWVSIALGISALAGFSAALRDGRIRWIAVAAAAALLFSSGTKGPLGPAYSWAVEHVPEIGVYRELYDLVGIVAIGYIVLLARGVGRTRAGAVGLALAGATFAIPWILVPPDRLFVSAGSLPTVLFPADAQTRVALEPAFQPMMTADGRGSGVDPDAYVRRGAALPLNEFFPSYPIDSALGYAVFRGDDSYLRALSVAVVMARPYLQTNLETLHYQWIAMGGERERQRARTLVPYPMLSLLPGPLATASIANRPDEAARFFGDTAPASVHRFVPSRGLNDARAAWVDARLAFPMHPEWGNAFGGVATQGAVPLSLPLDAAGSSLLAETDGALVDDAGRTVASRSTELHWWSLKPGTRQVVCRGTCIVALQGDVPAGLPEHRPMRGARPIAVDFVRPWLARAIVPANSSGTLRLNVRYDSAWRALADGRSLPHLRLDTTLNAWSVTTRAPLAVTFIETTAAVQLALELLAAVVIAGLFVNEALRAYRSRKLANSVAA